MRDLDAAHLAQPRYVVSILEHSRDELSADSLWSARTEGLTRRSLLSAVADTFDSWGLPATAQHIRQAVRTIGPAGRPDATIGTEGA